jgi:transcriptional regulator with XRE-family HTH domain
MMAPRRTVDQIIGERIRFRRQSLGLSMDQLAIKIGIRFGAVHKIEMGQTRMTIDRLFKIAKALDLPVERMLRGL